MADLPAVPDYYGQFMAPIQRQQALNIEQQNADVQRQQVALQLADAAQKLQRERQFTADAGSVMSSPSPEGYRALMLKYPDMHEGLQNAWQQYSDTEKQRDLDAASQVYSALQNGRSDLALSLLKDRQAAQQGAGQDDKVTDSAIEALESGDPAKVKQVQGMAGMMLASATGPDKIGPMLDSLTGAKGGFTLEVGATRFDANNNVVASSPYLKGVDGAIYERDTSTANPGSAATTVAGGQKAAIDHVLGNEGGYNPKDLNGSPTNFGINFAANKAELAKMGITPATFKNMTKDQAAQIYADKYWPESGAADLPANMQAPYFDVYVRSPKAAKRALAQSDGDPQKFMQLASGYFSNLAKRDPNAAVYAKAWANRDAGNTAIATGATTPPLGAPSDNAPAGYHTLIPGKPEGLPSGYEPDPAKPDDVLAKYNIAPTETGPAVLAKLPATVAAQVKALAEGRRAPPSSTALARQGAGAKYWNDVLQLTYQYDPTYDDSSFPARKAAITAFTGNGKGAQIVGSVNRVANHLQLLWNESARLAGPETGFGPLNTALATAGQAFQPQDAKAYDTEVAFVAGELGKIAKAGVVTESEIDRIIGNLSRKQSSSTRQSAIQAAVGIISGAVDPLKDQYNSAFTNNSARPQIPWVSPQAQKIYQKIGGVDLSLTGAGADTNTPAANNSGPVKVNSIADAMKLAPGTLFITPDGRTLRKK